MSGLSRADLTSNALLTLRASAPGSAPNTSYQVMPLLHSAPAGTVTSTTTCGHAREVPSAGST